MSKPVRACCWFLYHFGKLNSQNKFALFDHFDFLVSSSHSHPGKGRTNGRMCIQYMLIYMNYKCTGYTTLLSYVGIM